MTRVSSFGQQQQLITSMMESQNRVFTAQKQITTGKKSDDYAGMAGDVSTIIGAKNFKSRIESYESSITTIRGKLDTNDIQLEGMLSATRALKDNMLGAVASGEGEGLMPLLETSFKFIANALNTNIDGTFLFSGAKTGTQPVTVSELSDLDALATVGDAFENSNIGFEARIADGVTVEFGLLANEIGEEVFQEMYDLYVYNRDNGGALEGKLDDAAFSFLQGKLATMENAIDGMQQVQLTNGLTYERLEVVDGQHKDTVNYLEGYISDLEDVDIAEVISRLNNDQVALEASYRAVGSLTQLSLLNFL